MVLPVVVLVVLFIAILISYPWHLLTFGALLSSTFSASRSDESLTASTNGGPKPRTLQ